MHVALKSQCSKLDRLQERALRIIYYKKRYYTGQRRYVDVRELHKKYDIWTLNERRNQQLLCMMYKCSKNPSLLCENNPDERITRNATKIRFNIEFTNITRVQKSHLYRGKYLWNQLPECIQRSNSKYDFKQSIKSSDLDL